MGKGGFSFLIIFWGSVGLDRGERPKGGGPSVGCKPAFVSDVRLTFISFVIKDRRLM